VLGQNVVIVQPEAAAPLLGRYQNEALGEIELAFEDGTLWFDTGELRLELKALPSEAGAPPAYVVVEGLFLGLPLQAGAGEPPRQLILGSGVDAYEFIRLE
jgi:hypothetical protein